MAATNIYDYDVDPTAIVAIGLVGILGSNLPSNLDNAIRQLAANEKATFLDLAGANTVGGSADAITITPAAGNPSAVEDGMMISFVAGGDNTSTVTANVGGLGAEPVKKTIDGVETALVAGDIQSGNIYILRWRSSYDSSNGAWDLLSYGTRLLDEDDMASDSANHGATQQSIKAYVDAGEWVNSTLHTTSGSNTYSWTSLPADITEFEILFIGCSLNSTNNITITLGDSGGLETTGYINYSSYVNTATPVWGTNSITAGFLIETGATASNAVYGRAKFKLYSGVTSWAMDYHGSMAQTMYGFSLGRKVLSGGTALTQVQIAGTTFDGGSALLRYRVPANA